jgi:hypothetical protein
MILVDRRLLLDVEVMYRGARGLYETLQFPLQHSDFYLLVSCFFVDAKVVGTPRNPLVEESGFCCSDSFLEI